jgi:hypothetical protein
LGSDGQQADHGLNPKTHDVTLAAGFGYDPADMNPEGLAASGVWIRTLAFRGYGVATSRKDAIPSQPDDALS